VTDKAAALNCWRSCSGGCGRGVELGKEVFRDLMESMAERELDAPSGDVLNDGLFATAAVAARCSLLDKGDEGELGERGLEIALVDIVKIRG
jgi:hypothetical protein